MKMTKIVASTLAVGVAVYSLSSCVALATSSLGMAIIKRVLLGGIDKGVAIFKDKNSFLANDLVNKALPSELQSINQILGKVAPDLVAKQKDYIAQAASYTVGVSEPILKNAVNGLTPQDIERIATGAEGTATQILKEKAYTQLVSAITPKVDEELNKVGFISTINTALKGSSLLDSFLGTKTSTDGSALSRLASEQLVNGLFNIIEDHEKKNSQELYKVLK